MTKLNNQNIPIARNHNSKFDLSSDHVTTLSFMRCQPIYYAHLVAGQSLNMSCLASVRPVPMNVPTFGRMRCNLRSFFVPYRLAMPQYDVMMQDVIGSNMFTSSLVASPPVLDDYVVSGLIKGNKYSIAGTAQSHTFHVGSNYYTLNQRGRHFYKIFYSLGYDIMFSSKENEFLWNGLALLAYAKIIVDWYSNTNYLDSHDVLTVNQALAYNDPSNNLYISESLLESICNVIDKVAYDSNGYFENAFDSPVAPTTNQFTPLQWYDMSNPSPSLNYIGTSVNGTPLMNQASTSVTNIGSQYLHEMLEKITSYQRRHALAGSLAIDRFLAQHGRVTDHLRSMRSIYCGFQSLDVDVKSVFATANGQANNESSVVGDYAGAGFAQGSKDWSFTAEEDGIFLVLASVIPSGGYYQGYDRCNRRLTKTDFFNEEFDGTVQAMEKGEVYVSRDTDYLGVGTSAAYMDSFGFIGRYAEQKKGNNRVSGDISLHNVIAGGDSWHLMRDLEGFWDDITQQKHSLDFTIGVDGDSYNRIFNYTSPDYDPFMGFFHFAVGSYAPMRPLFDMFDFGTDVGKDITLQRGAKVN